jgi:hypothetical protein
MTWLERVMPTIEPTLRPVTSRPISSVEAPRMSRIAGTRPSQVAMPRPERPKTTKRAFRHITTWRRVSPPS